MKNKLKIIIIIFIVVLWSIYQVNKEYSWSDDIISQHIRSGWTVAKTTRIGSIELPWTWFKPPIRQIWFIDQHNLIKISKDLIIIPVRYYYLSYGSHFIIYSLETESDEYRQIIDCFNKRFVIPNERIDLNDINSTLSKLKWHTMENGSASYKIMEKICNLE